MTERVLAVAYGLASAALGVWSYLDPRSARFFRRSPIGGTWLAMTALPNGLGLISFVVGSTIGGTGVGLYLMVVGLTCVVTGWLAYYIHPDWAKPSWMRRRAD